MDTDYKILLYKGRLSILCEFKQLTLVRTNALLNKLFDTIEVSHHLLAAENFNFEISNNCEPKRRSTVGFEN